MRLLIIALLLFAIAAACGGSEDSAPADPTQPPTNTPAAVSGGGAATAAPETSGGGSGSESEKTGSAGYGVGAPRELPTVEGGVQTHQLAILNFAHQDATVKVGTAVVWHNQDGTSHTTTSGSPGDADAGALWDSGNLLFDGSFSHVFDQVGEFPYICTIHSSMQGTITVTQ